MSDSARIPLFRFLLRSGLVFTALAGLLALSALPGCPDTSGDDDSADEPTPVACSADASEPDNDLASAALVAQGDNGARTLCPDDADWLRVEVPAWRAWRVTLSTDDPLDINAAGFDESGASMALAQGNLAGGILLVLEHPEICPPGDDDDAGDDDDSAEAGTEPPAPVDRFIELTLDAASSGLSYRLDAVEDFPCAE